MGRTGWGEDAASLLHTGGTWQGSELQGFLTVHNNAKLIERQSYRLRRVQELRIFAQIRDVFVVVGLAFVFFFAPALQSIKLIADQSAGATASSRTADQAATAEVQQLISRR